MFNRAGCPGRRGQLASMHTASPFSSAVFDAEIFEFRVYWEIVVTKEKSQLKRIANHRYGTCSILGIQRAIPQSIHLCRKIHRKTVIEKNVCFHKRSTYRILDIFKGHSKYDISGLDLGKWRLTVLFYYSTKETTVGRPAVRQRKVNRTQKEYVRSPQEIEINAKANLRRKNSKLSGSPSTS
jgi:hypothetical protein